MKNPLLLGALLWFALLVGGQVLIAAQPEPENSALQPAYIEQGRQHYLKHCASCHGESGKGDGPLADSMGITLQNLQAHIVHHDDATLFQMITRGISPGMPGFSAALDMDEIINLIDYLYTLEASYQAISANVETAAPLESGTDMGEMNGDSDACPSQQMAGMIGSNDPMDAVWLGADLDGDNDPDQITICLQILEITQEIAPGIVLPVWVFAPDLGGMEPLARLPGPTLRVEQGDHVKIVVKNTHYFPHTLHMHGVLKPNAMDGVPGVTQPAILPGESFTYEFVAQNPGTYWYHCHVQTPVHLLMGLYGMLIIEPNRPQNFVTPIVMSSRMPDLSVATQEAGFDAEYTLIYQDIDPELHDPLNDLSLSLAQLEKQIHRDYNTAARTPRYFVLNGRSFPYTLLDTQIEVRSDAHVLLRVLNAGAKTVSLHIHGHHAEVVAIDGAPVPPAQRLARDTFTLTAAQRIDIDLNTAADGFHASGPGVWLLHDHTEESITTDGINPGGNITFLVYEDFVDVYGLPKVSGDLSPYFAPSYYRGADPVFAGSAFSESAAQPSPNDSGAGIGVLHLLPFWAWVSSAALLGLSLGAVITQWAFKLNRRKT